MNDDPVEAALAAFLDQLEGDGPEPSLEGLTPAQTTEAQQLFEAARAGRGIDSRLSPPSLAALLAGTEFEGLLSPDAGAPGEAQVGFIDGLSINAIVGEVLAALGPGSAPVADTEAFGSGVRSDAVLVVRGQRLRLQFRDELADPDELTLLDP
ncbi:MAG: hypothetical protein M3507_07185, partial [Actinomycetota bacterium]|nr:hypothetical protein [Actinomycetota bacterium]